jgi:predicted HicB family RNase H-like nuclease
MKYKGYTGIVEFDEESQVLSGRVIGLRDVITFEGDSVAEVIQAFHDSVDDYLDFCAQRGESPEKPYSGQFVLRLDPRLHRELAHVAEETTTSLNALIEGVLAQYGPVSNALVGNGGGKKSKGGAGREGRAKRAGPARTKQAKKK